MNPSVVGSIFERPLDLTPTQIQDSLRLLTGVGDLEIRLQKTWGSQNEDYRLNLRKALAQDFPSEDASLLSLRSPPSLEAARISISHARGLGGWATSRQARRLGFDVERRDRVRAELARRIAGPNELELAPTPVALWSAKEAAFKSLAGPLQPSAFAWIQIDAWSVTSCQDIIAFSARNRDERVQGWGWKVGAEHWASLCL